MELDELYSRPNRHRQAVTGHFYRVGGVGVDAPDATGGEHDGGGQQGDRLSAAVTGGDAAHPTRVHDQVCGEHVLMEIDVRSASGRGHQGTAHLGAGGIPIGVEDPAHRMSRLTAEQQLAVRPDVEPEALRRRRFGTALSASFDRPVVEPARWRRVTGVAVGESPARSRPQSPCAHQVEPPPSSVWSPAPRRDDIATAVVSPARTITTNAVQAPSSAPFRPTASMRSTATWPAPPRLGIDSNFI
jgi:hypothetical protein